MTNLEAIKAKLNYPLSDNSFILALVNRGLDSASVYSVSNLRLLELSQADLIVSLVSAPNVTEGGYQVSISDRKSLESVANGIYSKYDEYSPMKATATFKQIW